MSDGHHLTAENDNDPTLQTVRRGCFAFFVVFIIFMAYCVGRLHECLVSGAQRQNAEITKISAFLSTKPDRFGELTFNRGPVDKFHLEGAVQTQKDLDVLRAEMIRLFGEARADYILFVTVKSKATEASP